MFRLTKRYFSKKIRKLIKGFHNAPLYNRKTHSSVAIRNIGVGRHWRKPC